jgi:hypothetical protein
MTPFTATQTTSEGGIITGEPRNAEPPAPPIFCEGNKPVWAVFRRLMIALLRMLDDAYGWETFEGREK